MRESKAGPNFPIDEKNEKSYQFFFFFSWNQKTVRSIFRNFYSTEPSALSILLKIWIFKILHI